MERCPAKQGLGATEAFAAFAHWCSAESVTPSPSTQKAFGDALVRRRIAKDEGSDRNRLHLFVASSSHAVSL